MTENAFLSICISTYNRRDEVTKLIQSILKCRSKDLRVEVSDNASADGTFEALKQINDDRLLLSKAQENIGVFNSAGLIWRSASKYALICNDRDFVDGSKLDAFIDRLKREEQRRDIALVYLKKGFDSGNRRDEIKWFQAGANALSEKTLYDTNPTGHIVNIGFIHQCYESYDELCNNIVFGPLDSRYLFADLCAYGDYGMYDGRIVRLASKAYLAKSRANSLSGLHGGDETKLYFHPVYVCHRMDTLCNAVLLDGTMAAKLTPDERDRAFRAVTLSSLRRVTAYKAFQDIPECAHYGIKPRFIPLHRMIGEYNTFHGRVLESIPRLQLPDKTDKWWKGRYLKNILYVIWRSAVWDGITVKYILIDRNRPQKRFQ